MVCYACHTEKSLAEFHKNPHNSDGYNHTCKACCQAYHRDYINRLKIAPTSGMITCSSCREEKPLSEFYVARGTKTGYATQCKLCSKSAARKWRASNRERPFIDMVLSGNILCPRCNTEKDVSEFSHNKTNLSGYSDWCRACSKIYLAEYSAKNKEKISAQRRQHYKDLPQEEKDRLNSVALAWAKAHPDERKLTAKRFYANHPELCNDRTRAWQAANPEKVRQIAVVSEARKRARKKNDLQNDLTTAQWQEILAAFKHCCAYCGRKMQRLTQDHVTPLSKGGSNTASNVVPACKSCNSKKGDREILVPVQPLLLTIAPSRKEKH